MQTAATLRRIFVAQAAQQICGSTPTGEALLSTRLEPEAADNVAQLLAGLGFRTALDLRLLGGGPEAEELMGELQADGGRLSIGDRAKVRLLIGNHVHLRRLGAAPPQGHGKMRWRIDVAVPGQKGNEEARRRVLQGKTNSDDGMSMDTIAIVFTVLVGAAGCLVQVRCACWHISPPSQMACTLTATPLPGTHCAAVRAGNC